ncbi:hypothetical protein [Actinomadura flavalba]|uniref:hypothetical protein n=1 Tax=Actinomadura flavalba TaxID=1120938 RepID=UPI00035EC3DB|nr:hypothetical protein [Actinomadura flavalba]
MRALFVPFAVGTAVVVAGLAAPTGEATIVPTGAEQAGQGRRTEVVVPGCTGTGDYAESRAFTARVSLSGDGSGVATVRPDAPLGRHPVTARCGARTVRGAIVVTQERAWQGLLPPSLAFRAS